MLRAADVVAGAPDALQPARHRARRLDLHHQIDRAHVDAELERGRRGDRAQPAGLERLLDLLPLVRARPSRGARAPARRRRGRAALDRELGELLRQALGEPARVDEHDRRAVREDQLEQPRVDQRPHAAPPVASPVVGARRGRSPCRRPAPRSARSSARLRARVDDLDRPVAAQIARDLDKRPLGRRQADALRLGVAAPVTRWPSRSSDSAEVDAALGRRERVDLVDDDRVDRRAAARAHGPASSRYSDSGVVIRICAGIACAGARAPWRACRRCARRRVICARRRRAAAARRAARAGCARRRTPAP